MSTPLSSMVPAVGSSRRVMLLATVDLPQPDSPTRHSVSPRRDLERDAVDGEDMCGNARQQAAMDRKVLLQVLDPQNGVRGAHGCVRTDARCGDVPARAISQQAA